MKKLSTIIIAAALLLGMAQCKKQETPASEGNVVRITLNVGGNGNDSKVIVTPPDVNFENGDQIVVASNGAVVGTLTKEGEYFTGAITDATEGQPLYFYFLGNKQGMVANGATTCTVNISDQTTDAGLPVISMGASGVPYSSDVTSYQFCLKNMASLQKFVVTTTSNKTICITGMNNTVTVNFDSSKAANDDVSVNNGFTYDSHYEPWSIGTNNNLSDCPNFWAYGEKFKNLFDAKADGSMRGQADWGYNKISNGGNEEGLWRTLTKDEWTYIFSRPNSWAKATVNNVNGMIVLPDNWDGASLNNANVVAPANGYGSNVISEADWTTYEDKGAVFLPITGVLQLTWQGAIFFDSGDLTGGYYWTSSARENNQSFVYQFRFTGNDYADVGKSGYLDRAYAVRLVQDVQ